MKDIKAFKRTMDRLITSSKLGLDPRQVMLDIAQYAYNGISNPILWNAVFPQGRVFHQEWMAQDMKKYGPYLDHWEMFKELASYYLHLVETSPPFTDIMEVIGLSDTRLSKTLGQFLSPSKVADGGAAVMGVPPLENGEHFTVGDPTGSGAGSLLLGWLRFAHKHHPTRLNQVHLLAVDIDLNMAKLTATQIALSSFYHRIPLGSLKVHCADAIRDYHDFRFNKNQTMACFFTGDWGEYQKYIQREQAEELQAA